MLKYIKINGHNRNKETRVTLIFLKKIIQGNMLKLMITTKEKKTCKINRFNKNYCMKIKINDYNKNKETRVKLTVSIKIIIRKHVKINDHKKK